MSTKSVDIAQEFIIKQFQDIGNKNLDTKEFNNVLNASKVVKSLFLEKRLDRKITINKELTEKKFLLTLEQQNIDKAKIILEANKSDIKLENYTSLETITRKKTKTKEDLPEKKEVNIEQIVKMLDDLNLKLKELKDGWRAYTRTRRGI